MDAVDRGELGVQFWQIRGRVSHSQVFRNHVGMSVFLLSSFLPLVTDDTDLHIELSALECFPAFNCFQLQ
jgi:hypothetical protein